MYHNKQEMAPNDRKEGKKLLTREHLEKGPKTTKSEKRTLLGTKKKSVR